MERIQEYVYGVATVVLGRMLKSEREDPLLLILILILILLPPLIKRSKIEVLNRIDT